MNKNNHDDCLSKHANSNNVLTQQSKTRFLTARNSIFPKTVYLKCKRTKANYIAKVRH